MRVYGETKSGGNGIWEHPDFRGSLRLLRSHLARLTFPTSPFSSDLLLPLVGELVYKPV